jgi:hypothetical protein
MPLAMREFVVLALLISLRCHFRFEALGDEVMLAFG